MKERPILFNGPMVRALLDGSKTQTRRIMKPQPEPTSADYPGPKGHRWPSNAVRSMVHVEQELQNKSGGWGGLAATCGPYGRLGDRLYVRETWAQPTTLDPGPTIYRADYPGCVPAEYINVPPADEVVWKPSIHMPRALARITLEIIDVRVEHLQDISEADALAEGITYSQLPDNPQDDQRARTWYRGLWEMINGTGSWSANPWVWVVEFCRVDT